MFKKHMHARSIPKIQKEGLLAGHYCTQNRCLNVKIKKDFLFKKYFLTLKVSQLGIYE